MAAKLMGQGVALTEDEVNTVIDLIRDWGFEYSLQADSEKVKALAQSLGMSDEFIKMNFS